METVTVFCPAKVNLTLAVTGRRDDGYHDLVSLAAPLTFGDILKVRRTREPGLSLAVSGEAVPEGDDNLVLRAARRFLERVPAGRGFAFELAKKVPAGAGLGGGSSNAAGTLLALNEILDYPLEPHSLVEIAAEVGADCPLFLQRSPVIMRGKGESVERLSEDAAMDLRGRTLVLFKPFFGISTEWAYRCLSRTGTYTAAAEAEAKIGGWLNGTNSLASLLRNDFEKVAGRKYPGISILLEALRRDPGLPVLMSGSGSAAFALVENRSEAEVVGARVRDAYGSRAFLVETEFC